MTQPTIISISDKTNYSRRRTPIQTEDRQEFWVDVGVIATKVQVIALLDAQSSMPGISQQNAYYPWLYCIGLDYIQMDDMPNVWVVNVVWRSLTNAQDKEPDPLKRAALISRGTYKQQDIPNVDFDNKPVATTAGEPINYQYQRAFPTYTIQKFLPQFPTWCGKANDFVNSDAVTLYGITFKPYELFIPDIEVGYAEYQGQYGPYYNFKATMYADIRPDGWRTKLRNAGFHELKFLGWFTAAGTALLANFANAPSPGQQQIRLGGVTYYARYGLASIQLNLSGKPEYPSSPILLDPFGSAFRSKLPADPPTGPFTGPVIGLKSANNAATTSGITQDQWNAAVVSLRFVNPISFNTYLPLR